MNALSISDARPPDPARPLDRDLRGYLESNADIVTRITTPVSMDYIGALSAQSETPILFENIVEKPGFRICDILAKNRGTQSRALGVPRENYLRTLAYRLRKPPRGLVNVRTGPVKELVLTGKVKVKPFVEMHPLDDINRVFEAVHHREIRRRAVLVPTR